MTLKTAGLACPKCSERCPAEFAQKGERPQWRCLKCGAGGELTGQFDGREFGNQTQPPPPAPKRHWRG